VPPIQPHGRFRRSSFFLTQDTIKDSHCVSPFVAWLRRRTFTKTHTALKNISCQ
jgi:hypothetical protein